MPVLIIFFMISVVDPQSVRAIEGFVIEEILVTAQKRTENVQDIPVSISAFDADFLKSSNIVGVDKLVSYTPGLNGTAQQDSESVFTVRGIGTYAFGVGADNSVGMFIDDVPVGRPTLIGNSFFDLARVEVVKGPQGTLFGRNASAGAISIITQKPDLEDNALHLTLGAGNESQELYEVIGNLAMTDQFGVRLAVRGEERDGTFKNRATGDELNNRDHTNARLSLRYEPGVSVTADFSAEHVAIDTRSGFNRVEQAFSSDVAQNPLPSQDIESLRAALKFGWEISESLSLTSNTSYIDYDLVAVPVDVDVSETFVLNLQEPQEGDQFVQEFRLNGSASDLDWFVGTSYIVEQIESHTTYQYSDAILGVLLAGVDCSTSPIPCLDFVEQRHSAETDNTSYALYGDLTWQITEQLKLTLGARYTRDKKEFEINQPVPGSATSALTGDAVIKLGTSGVIEDDETWTSLDPRVVLDYRLATDILVYASVASGYKSGGFNSDPNNSLASGLPQKPAVFDEEKVTAYEVGLKSRFWEGRAQVNLSAYFNDYEDFQVEAGDLVILIENAADVETRGLELEGSFLLTENLTLMANYSYLDAEFKKGAIEGVDVAGRPLQRAPDHSGAIVGIYVNALGDLGELTLRADYIYSDAILFKSENPVIDQDSYELFNARIELQAASERWGIALIGENLGDEEYLVHRTDPLFDVGVPVIRSLYRLELTAKF